MCQFELQFVLQEHMIMDTLLHYIVNIFHLSYISKNSFTRCVTISFINHSYYNLWLTIRFIVDICLF